MNEDLKKKYIEATQNKFVEQLFEKIKSYEDKLGKDLSTFSTKEIMDYYKLMQSPSGDFLNNINCQFRMYTSWCQEQNLVADNQNHYFELDYKMIMSCVNLGLLKDKIITRKKLLEMLERLSANPVDQFIPLAIFEGICGDRCSQLLSLRKADVEKGSYALSNGVIVEMSDELIKYGKKAADEYVYYSENSKGKRSEFPLDPGDDRVIKKVITHGGQDDEVHYSTVQKKLRKMQDLLGAAGFTVKALKESGRIHLIKETMKGHSCSVEEAISLNRNIEGIYGEIQSYKAYAYKYSIALNE